METSDELRYDRAFLSILADLNPDVIPYLEIRGVDFSLFESIPKLDAPIDPQYISRFHGLKRWDDEFRRLGNNTFLPLTKNHKF